MVLNKNLNLQLKAMAINSISTAIKMVHPSPTNSDSETNKIKVQVKTFNFMDSFKPVYFILRLLGLRPFSIVYDSNGEAQQPKITIIDGIWFIISMGLYVLMAYSTEGIDRKEFPVEGFVYILGYIFTIFGLFCSILTIVVDMCNRFKFVEILRNITVFDKEVRNPSHRFIELIDLICMKLHYSDDQHGNAFQLSKDVPTQLSGLYITNSHSVRNHVDINYH